MAKLKVALLCGGPSLERGISLNSARSVLDHLQAPDVAIFPIYFDWQRRAYELAPAHLYSNTPSDFDFKIDSIGQPLPAGALHDRLRQMDIVFPAVHGAFGEDGGVQQVLEQIGVPFVGSGSAACRLAFDKYDAARFLAERGFYTLPSLLLEGAGRQEALAQVAVFFARHQVTGAVVKPARAGSSVGVHLVGAPREAVEAMQAIVDAGIDSRVIVEPFCQGQEFTLILLENPEGQPVALLPTEIGIDQRQQIFDYRKKYLPTAQVTYYVPPRFHDATVARIRQQGQRLFRLFGMRDVARFDGWVLSDGRIWFSDFNLVSGMEQNSFLFLQAAQLGMSHADLLRYLLQHACARHGLRLPDRPPAVRPGLPQRQRVNVIFGGSSSERHVSLMSGTNVWLKLLRSPRYEPHPYLLDPAGQVWELPYALTLRHTVEEVADACERALSMTERLERYRQQILEQLRLSPAFTSQTDFLPRRMSLEAFVAHSPLVFIAIHGGIGENGELQALLEAAGVPFTGSSAAASRLCMDKYATGLALAGLEDAGIFTAPKRLARTASLAAMGPAALARFWEELKQEMPGDSLIVKPSDDGCSSGVVRLYSADDLQRYVELTVACVPRIPAGTFPHQPNIVEMPTKVPANLLFEKFIVTDQVSIVGNRLHWPPQSGWVEVTCGLLGPAGQMRALTPSITLASGNVLSLEEKFQGGTGVNITPPPPQFVPPQVLQRARQAVATVARTLGMGGFGRIDAFLHAGSGELIVIEANTIPGLTPSTVIFHQALAEPEPLFPQAFLEQILDCRQP